MKPPVAYQGGKQRLAVQILDLIDHDVTLPFVDLCCGSGAVALEAITRGVPVSNITMVDAGPWGMFWETVGDGTFDLEKFDRYLDAIGDDPALIHDRIKTLALEPVCPEVFVILQAAAFGSKAVQARDGLWVGTWRSYWLPTATSSRRSPVNPMMPMPVTLRSRIHALVPAMGGVNGIHGDVQTVVVPDAATVYIDPPYVGTTGYGSAPFDVVALAARLARSRRVFVSEAAPLTDETTALHLGAKGGISGERKTVHSEWLSAWPDPSSDTSSRPPMVAA